MFISYKRDVQPDAALAQRLYRALTQAGHRVFIDQTMLVGEDWVKRIRQEVEGADSLILLLSEVSVQSQMVAEEVRIAEARRKETGTQPAILPVRVGYQGALPYDLGAILNRLNYALWQQQADDSALIAELRHAIEGREALSHHEPLSGELPVDIPLPSANPRAPLEAPEGTMDPESPYYVLRPADQTLCHAQQQSGYTVSIQAARQMGKSSLLSRILQKDRAAGKAVAFIDFQAFGRQELQDGERLCHQFAFLVEDALDLGDSQLERYWNVPLSPIQKCTRFMERRILPACPNGLLLALDECDSLLYTPTRSDFFGMLRSWHNERATKPHLWRRFSLALVISTEPAMLIDSVTQSPFNVGTHIKLEDFDLEQCRTLNAAHGQPLSVAQLQALHEQLAGHPYLMRKAMYLVAQGRYQADRLLQEAASETGPFGDHLRAALSRLSRRPELPEALRNVVNGRAVDGDTRMRLIAGGLVKEQQGRLVARNPLYQDYFRRVL